MVGEGFFLVLRKVPFVRVFLFFSAGIGVGYVVPIAPWAFKLLLGLVTCLFLLLLAVEMFGRKRRRMLFPLFFYVWLFLLGVVWMGRELPGQKAGHFADTEAERLVGIIADEPIYGEATIRFPVRIRYIVDAGEIHPATGRIMLSIARNKEKDDIMLAYGDKLLFRNKVTSVRMPYNPKQFDYKRYLAHNNIYHQAYIFPEEVRHVEGGKGHIIVAKALEIRQYLVRKFADFIADNETREVCSALILGYRANFDAETLAAFINTGTVHVLSVSGLHVGMVFYLLNLILRFLDRFPRGRPVRFTLILLAIWGYVLLTGMAPSILRAGVMISFLLVAGWSNRANQNLNSLFASACFLLLFDPFMLFDMGFQLSYLAVLGLFTLYPMLNRAFPANNRWVRAAWQAVLVSISAQLFTTPLAIYYFQQFPNYFLLGNLFVMLPATGLMYAGLALTVSPFAWLNMYLGMGLTYLSRCMLWGLKAIEELPFATAEGLDLSTSDLLLSSLAILLLLLAWSMMNKPLLWAMVLTIGVVVLSTTLTAIQYISFRGIKVYNVGREVAIAFINRGHVSLLSTLDSVMHPRLAMQVLPDLRHYTRTEDITFRCLKLLRGEQWYIRTEIGTVGIMEGKMERGGFTTCNILLWRNIPPYYDASDNDFAPRTVILFDASNSAGVLPPLVQKAKALHHPYYILKDNFAYIWESK